MKMLVSRITKLFKKQNSLLALAKVSLDRLRFYSAYVQLAIQCLILDRLDGLDWKIILLFSVLPVLLLFDIVFVYPAEQATAYVNSPLSDKIDEIQKKLNQIETKLGSN